MVDAESRAAREEAEKIVDDLLQLLDEDLASTAVDERFELLISLMRRSPANRTTLAAALVAALERLHVKEQLDRDLSER